MQGFSLEVTKINPFYEIFCFLNVVKRYFWVGFQDEIVENDHSMTMRAQINEINTMDGIWDTFKVIKVFVLYQIDEVSCKD